MRRGFFLTGTGTGVGKTWLTRGLARACLRRGRPIPALKPLETGCDPDPVDALALERASGVPGTARARGLYRARLPAAPYAATRSGEPAPPGIDALTTTLHCLAGPSSRALVEGAGGWLVPMDDRHDVASLQLALGLPAILVAPDRLGVLSDTLALAEVARTRGLPLAAIVLARHAEDPTDPTPATNAAILAERVHPVPVHGFPAVVDDDDTLADAVEAALPSILTALDC